MRILTSTTIAVSLSLSLISPSFAVSLVTNRADLKGNDSIDWSSLGKVLNPFNPNFADFLGFSFSGTSAGGLGLDVDINPINPPITPPFVFKTAPIPQGIPTNFANGDFLLFTGLQFGLFPAPGNPGPISISFAQPVGLLERKSLWMMSRTLLVLSKHLILMTIFWIVLVSMVHLLQYWIILPFFWG